MTNPLLALIAFVGTIFISGGETPPVGSNSLTASFTARPIQGTTCVAPCAVHFDAIGEGSLSTVAYTTPETTDTVFGREFHSLLFQWDFDDPSAGTWTNTGLSKNSAFGGIAAHLYTIPDTYTVTLKVTNPAGDTDTVTHDVTVSDPNTVFTTAQTWCFSNDAGFLGCSLDTNSDGTCDGADADHCIITSDMDLSLSSNTDTIGCNVDQGGAKAWCQYEAGDTFSMSAAVIMLQDTNPGLISSYGAGANPIIDMNGQFIADGSGWTWDRIDRTDAPSVPAAVLAGGFPSTLRSHPNGLTYYGFNISTVYNCYEGDDDTTSPHFSTKIAFIDVSCTLTNTTLNLDVFPWWMNADYYIWMGGTLDGNGTIKAIRGHHYQHSIVQHVKFKGGQYSLLQFRNEERSEGDWGTYWHQEPEADMRFVLISDNILEIGPSISTITRICPDSGCNCTQDAASCPNPPSGDTGAGVKIHDIIYERNLFKYTGPRSTVADGARLWGGDITFRDNVIDFGVWLNGSGFSSIVNFKGDSLAVVHGYGLSSNTGCDVYGNTIYIDESSTGAFGFNASGSSGTNDYGSGCTSSNVLNNLVVSSSGSPSFSSSGFTTVSNNIAGNTTSYGFASALPALASRSMSSYARSGSLAGRAFNSSTDLTFWDYIDGQGLCRPVGGIWDIGAMQYGASACP